ncbi:MAG: tetratricopeptide repeat protein [Gallionella sp.]
MSVINQVLNQLEERGAHQVAEQDMVRAVPQSVRNNSLWLLPFGLALLGVIAGWLWVQSRQPIVTAGSATRSVPMPIHGRPNIAGAGNSPPALESGQSTQLHQAAPIEAPVAGISGATLPASRLSFELSSVPLPSAISHEAERKHEKATAATARAAAKPDRKPATKVAKKSARKSSQKTDTEAPALQAADAEIAAAPAQDSGIPMKQISSGQLSDAEFRKASALLQQGRVDDAMSGYRAALRLDAGNDQARQALVAVLLDNKRGKDAERVLQERLDSKPEDTRFTMMLARLQVERGAVAEATATLEKALPYADSQADYQAFLAALLQRQNRNDEAVAHYQIALQLAPNNGIWQMGYGISLQALNRNADAKTAFQHALDTRTLSPDLQAFVLQRMKQL